MKLTNDELLAQPKKPEYDKPRIASTVVISVLVTIALIFFLLTLKIDWSLIREAVDENTENSENAAGAIAGGFVIALFGSLVVVFAIIINVANIINAGICLPFAIKNRRSTLKGVRIYSYVLDGITGAVLLANIIKLIYLFVTAKG